MRRLRREDVPLATDELAHFLIGVTLVRRFDDESIASGLIVETEAYVPTDPASHSYRGMTNRNRTMFGANFHAYVYFIFGTAYCLNISSEGPGVGAAVLIRALEPLAGLGQIRARRAAASDRDLLRGPGRLCAGLDIDRRFDGADLDSDPRLWLAAGEAPRPPVGRSTRIGLSRSLDVEHRFFARGSAYLSGKRALSPHGG